MKLLGDEMRSCMWICKVKTLVIVVLIPVS